MWVSSVAHADLVLGVFCSFFSQSFLFCPVLPVGCSGHFQEAYKQSLNTCFFILPSPPTTTLFSPLPFKVRLLRIACGYSLQFLSPPFSFELPSGRLPLSTALNCSSSPMISLLLTKGQFSIPLSATFGQVVQFLPLETPPCLGFQKPHSSGFPPTSWPGMLSMLFGPFHLPNPLEWSGLGVGLLYPSLFYLHIITWCSYPVPWPSMSY